MHRQSSMQINSNNRQSSYLDNISPLNAKPPKWSNALKRFVRFFFFFKFFLFFFKYFIQNETLIQVIKITQYIQIKI